MVTVRMIPLRDVLLIRLAVAMMAVGAVGLVGRPVPDSILIPLLVGVAVLLAVDLVRATL